MKTTRMTDPTQILPSPKSLEGTPEKDLPVPETDSLQERMPDTGTIPANIPAHPPTHTKLSSDHPMEHSETDQQIAAMDGADHHIPVTPPHHRSAQQVGPIVKGEIDLERNQTGIQRLAGRFR